ncbi:MAG: trypsin-like peptidase domain-containing protein [Methylocella sp.]
MSNNGVEQIVIRHVSGSKANQIEHISLAGVNEIMIGRDPKSKIAFDSSRDDIVSRRHAIIRVVRDEQISFRLADLGSNNGTFLNGERITEEVELLPEDTIELGKNGVKFIFNVQPRPANLVARTRVIDVGDAAVTRAIKTAGTSARDAVSTSDTGTEPAFQKFEPPPKVGVGKETLLHMLGEERRAASRIWTSSLAGLAVVGVLGGGFFYWKHKHDIEEMHKQEVILASKVDQSKAYAQQKIEEEERKRQEEERGRQEARGLSPQEIVEQFGNATAHIYSAWRLYDQTTGKPVFHKKIMVKLPKMKESMECPAYVDLGKYGIVRWLTLEDDNRRNIPIGERSFGTGFAVSEQGFMLTNKHIAAAWNLAFGQADPATYEKEHPCGWLYLYDGGTRANKRKLRTPQLIDLSDDAFSDLRRWVPASGGIVFMKDLPRLIGTEGNIPDPSKSDKRTFFGRNDVLEVRFANSRGSANANLVNFSNASDAALIKVDTPQQLKKLDIAADDTVTVGETVIAVGFPAVAAPTVAESETIENGQNRQIRDEVPQPFVSEGIVAVISPAVKTENGVTFGGKQGDVIQMSINSTGSGNSGGPVFNKSGKVIGLFTYGKRGGGAVTTEAVPIKYGRDLLLSQHP